MSMSEIYKIPTIERHKFNTWEDFFNETIEDPLSPVERIRLMLSKYKRSPFHIEQAHPVIIDHIDILRSYDRVRHADMMLSIQSAGRMVRSIDIETSIRPIIIDTINE